MGVRSRPPPGFAASRLRSDLLIIENHLVAGDGNLPQPAARENYPLLTQKQADFILFKNILELIRRKEHLTPSGLNEIVSCKAAMNKGLSGSLKEAFLDIIPKDRLIISNSNKLGPPRGRD